MDLGFLNLLLILLLLVLAALEFRKTNAISPWVNTLFNTVISLISYYFIPISATRFGLLEGDAIAAASDQALILNLVGTVTFCVIFYLVYPIFSQQSGRQQIDEPQFAFPEISDVKCLYFLSAASLASSAILLGVMAYTGIFPLLSGEVLESRAFINNYPELRPVFNLASSLISPILSYFVLMVVLKWKAVPKAALLPIPVLILAGSLTGTRSFLLGLITGPILGLSLLWITKRSRFRISFLMLLAYQFLFVIAGGVSGLLRVSGLEETINSFVGDPGSFLLFSSFFAFTGDTFSDLRDFSWVLSKFNGEFYQGKTILAGALGFLPSFVLPFREEFTFSRVTNTIVGLPVDTHFGLRASRFGEWYLNFGWIGVIALGIILGIGYAFIQGKFNELLFSQRGDLKVFSLSTVFLMVSFLEAFTSTNIFFIIYVQAALLLLTYWLGRRSKPFSEMGNQPLRSDGQL